MSKTAIILVSIAAILILIYTQITLFVIQPIGALPEGKTLVMLRMNQTNFVESPDSLCVRELGGLSLMCRMAALGAALENGVVLFKMPYFKSLYLISTDGQEFDR